MSRTPDWLKAKIEASEINARFLCEEVRQELEHAVAEGVPGAEEMLRKTTQAIESFKMSMEFLDSLQRDEDGNLSDEDLALLDAYEEFTDGMS